MRRISVIVGAVICSGTLLATVAVSAPASGASSSAKSRYKAAIVYAGKHNVHYASKATHDAAVLRVVGNTSPTAGSQTLTVKNGSVSETLTVTLVGSTGYLKGDAEALQEVVGLPATDAQTYDEKWLSFPSDTQALEQLTSGLINSGVAAELSMSGPYKFGKTITIDGTQAQAVIGYAVASTGPKVPTTLYIETGGTARPIEEVSTSGTKKEKVHGAVTFSNWGQSTHVTAPTGAVSLLSIAPTG